MVAIAYCLAISVMVICSTALFLADKNAPAIALLVLVALSSYKELDKGSKVERKDN